MRFFLKVSSAVAFIIFLSFTSAAQQKDAVVLWNTTTINKSFGQNNRFTVGLMSEYRHMFHEGRSGMSQYFVRPSFSYKAFPWLKLQYQMDFAATASSGFNWRFIPEATVSHKTGDFTIALRQRVMTTWKVAAGTNSTVFRTRAKVDYSIRKTPLSINFAVEPYWCEFSKTDFAWFQKCRWYAGFNLKLTDHLILCPQYICQAYHNHKGHYNRRTYDDHVIYMTLLVRL